jgi:glutaredoxin
MVCSRPEPGGRGRPGHVVTLYSARGCHLCENARRVLEQVSSDMPFELHEVDITGDEELEASYRELVPVVLIDGEQVFTHFVHPDALRRRLA